MPAVTVTRLRWTSAENVFVRIAESVAVSIGIRAGDGGIRSLSRREPGRHPVADS